MEIIVKDAGGESGVWITKTVKRKKLKSDWLSEKDNYHISLRHGI